eukprot:1086358-Prorocentrum_lima.AAC.1
MHTLGVLAGQFPWGMSMEDCGGWNPRKEEHFPMHSNRTRTRDKGKYLRDQGQTPGLWSTGQSGMQSPQKGF